ncbi:hypothetical protein BDZ94DRAFT_1297549 [Collybia nuda]|uniref:Uncharacterized protein n=1 Tax=Collybia nuda TaxID=64659 RepID=A0A9P5Y8W5_9AGAR|nr:hypothetical protein BDZ94DRAFT_1297549 [Collybia nuda]
MAQIDLMPEDIAPLTTETDQVDDILDMFYVDSESDGLDAMEQEDVDLYNLYGDGSATPYTRPSSPQQDTSQAKDMPERGGTLNDEDTSRLTYDNTEDNTDEKVRVEKDIYKEHEETTDQDLEEYK